jgi:dTDP-4-dehydrorhamnose reductase
MQRWLISGASGQLGGHILRALSDRHPGDFVHAVSRASVPGAHVTEWVDLRSSAAVTDLLRRTSPTHILHLAAVSSPLDAESDPASCQALHVEAAKRMAMYAAATNGWMLYASSDFVWEGSGEFHEEGDVPLPTSVYGKSKLAGERIVAEHGCGLIARYSALFGFPVDQRQTSWTAIAARLERNEPVIAVDDEWRSPINLADAAWATIELATQRHRGLVHISGLSAMTPYEIIAMMRRELNSASEVQRVSRASFSPNVIRPRNVTQSIRRLRSLLPEFQPAPLRSALFERAPAPRFSVIIPVYYGADTLGRSLNALADQRFDDCNGLRANDVELLLALNDGRKDSEVAAEAHVASLRARSFHVRLLRTPPTRLAAIATAEEAAAMGTHRLYLDQDARLSPHALSAIFAALTPGTGIHFAAPRGLFDPSPSLLVRAFCRYWCSLPYSDASPVTMGAYAVSAEGRRRWGALPHLASDDKFVRMLFAPEERRLLASESYHVVAPRDWGELIRARRRYLRGNRELARATHLAPLDPIPRYRGVLRPLLRPSAWFDFAVFGATNVATWLAETARARMARRS